MNYKKIDYVPVGKTAEEKYNNIWNAIYNGRSILIKITNCAKKGIYGLFIEGSPFSANRSLNFEYYYRDYSHDTVAVLPEDIADSDISFLEEVEVNESLYCE